MIIGYCKKCRKKFRKREHKYLFCSLSCASNYNKNGINDVRLPRYKSSLAEFVGICLGDGCTSRFQVTISLNATADKDYLPHVTELIKKLFPGATISIIEREEYNMIDIKINSVLVSKFMKRNGIVSNNKYVPKWILKRQAYIKACIRGLFDTEGSISFKLYKTKSGISLYKQLNFRNYNLQLMTFIRDSLLLLDFKPTTTLKKSLYLSTHEGINKFRQMIGFSNPKLSLKSKIETISQYQTVYSNIPELK